MRSFSFLATRNFNDSFVFFMVLSFHFGVPMWCRLCATCIHHKQQHSSCCPVIVVLENMFARISSYSFSSSYHFYQLFRAHFSRALTFFSVGLCSIIICHFSLYVKAIECANEQSKVGAISHMIVTSIRCAIWNFIHLFWCGFDVVGVVVLASTVNSDCTSFIQAAFVPDVCLTHSSLHTSHRQTLPVKRTVDLPFMLNMCAHFTVDCGRVAFVLSPQNANKV